MSNLENNIKEVVNTGLGALGEIGTAITSNKVKADDYIKSTQTKVDETKDMVVKYLEDLKSKGASDESELAVNVRNAIKDVFVNVDSSYKKVEEFTSVNYEKLKLELAKYDITLPDVSEIQGKFDTLITDGKSKIDELKASLTKENVEAKAPAAKPAPKAKAPVAAKV